METYLRGRKHKERVEVEERKSETPTGVAGNKEWTR